MDAFSEVLSGVRLQKALSSAPRLPLPGSCRRPRCRVLAATLAPDVPHMLIYHFAVDGSACVSLDGCADVELSPGAIVRRTDRRAFHAPSLGSANDVPDRMASASDAH